MQNCPFSDASNLLRVAANRQHSAGRFPPSSWHHWAWAVGQWVMKQLLNQAASFTFPLPPCLFLSHMLSLEYSTLTESFPCSQHGRADAGWKTFLFSSSQWENEPVSGIGRDTAFTAFFYWEQVQYVSASSHHFHFARHKDALPLHTFPTTEHCHLSYSKVTKTDKQEKSRMRTVLFCFLMCNTIFCLFNCSFQTLLIYQAQLPDKQEQKYTITKSSQSHRKTREQRQRRRREGGREEGRQQPAASPVADSLLSQLDPVCSSFSNTYTWTPTLILRWHLSASRMQPARKQENRNGHWCWLRFCIFRLWK